MKPTKFDLTITIIMFLYMAMMIWLSGCGTTRPMLPDTEPIGAYHNQTK